MLGTQRLNLAGWLSVTKAVLSIPILVLSLVLGAPAELGRISGFGARAGTALLTVASVALFVYVFSTLRMLLEERYAFRETGDLIRILIVVNVVMAVLSVVSIASPTIASAVEWLSLFAIVPLRKECVFFSYPSFHPLSTLP
jgi:hypothetical protein